eukprot:364398-Chlamydomonas_euryale.AAC.17
MELFTNDRVSKREAEARCHGSMGSAGFQKQSNSIANDVTAHDHIALAPPSTSRNSMPPTRRSYSRPETRDRWPPDGRQKCYSRSARRDWTVAPVAPRGQAKAP